MMRKDILLKSPNTKQELQRYDKANAAILKIVPDVTRKAWHNLYKPIYQNSAYYNDSPYSLDHIQKRVIMMLKDQLIKSYKAAKKVCLKYNVRYVTVPLHGPYTFHFSPRSMISSIRIYPNGWLYAVNRKNEWSARHKLNTGKTEINALYWLQSSMTQGGPYVGATQNFIALWLKNGDAASILSTADFTLTKKSSYRGDKIYAIEALILGGYKKIWERISQSAHIYKCNKIEILYLLNDIYRLNGQNVNSIPSTLNNSEFHTYVINHNCRIYDFFLKQKNIDKHWDRDIKIIKAAFQNRLR